MSEELKKEGSAIIEGATNAIADVKEEASEVIQEAKASIKGETLQTANIEGAAGYRESSKEGKNGSAVASLVLGILSLVFALFGYGAFLGLVFAIIGVILGAKARKISQTGLATGGFVCSIIGLILNGVVIACVVACAGAIGAAGLSGLLSQ